MTTGRDALVVGRVGWADVAWDFAGLLGRALALATAVGLLLTAVAVTL